MEGLKEHGPHQDSHGIFSIEEGDEQLWGRPVNPGVSHHNHAVSHSTKPGAQVLPQVHTALLCPLTNGHLQEEERNPNAQQH